MTTEKDGRRSLFARRSTVLCAALVAVTVGVYLQTGAHPFISFDDPGYVTENPRVQGGVSGENAAWAFTTTAMSNWHPLTWLSHMTDVELFGLSPWGHHLTNVLFHAVSTLLLFVLLSRMTGAPWNSLFVASLFALHPLHVESVAWVSERKDVLSGFFWFLTLLLYGRYVERPGKGRYLLVLGSFAAGLLAKPMLVTLPVVLLLLDRWPLGRVGRPLVREKIPLFALSALSSAVTVYAQQQGGALKSFDAAPVGQRIGNAVIAYAKYIGKTLWPRDLAILYPFPALIPLWQVAGAIVLLILVSALVVVYRRSHPYLATGWAWFLITLVPVIGLVQVGGQALADRYTYIPLTGLFIMAGWALPDLLQGRRHRRAILVALASAVVSASAGATWLQIGYWKNNLSLYRRALDLTTGNYQILNNYGIALAQEGRLDEAILRYRESLKIDPKRPMTYNNLGIAYSKKGMSDHAILQFQIAIALDPGFADAHNNLGIAYSKKGWIRQAEEEISLGMKLRSLGNR